MREVVEFIWTVGDADYKVEPRMGQIHDDAGRDTGVQYQLGDLFGPEWNVYFMDGKSQTWRKSRITTFGALRRDAVIALLDQAFDKSAWSDLKKSCI